MDTKENISTFQNETLLLAWNEELARGLLPINVFLVLYVIIGCLGNIIVIYIYNSRMKVKMDDRFFILMLAGTDVIVCLTGSSFSLVRNLLPVNFNGNIICKCVWYVTKIMNAISVMLILLISAQRYLKICRPFGWQLNNFRKKVALTGMVILCLVTHAPILIFYGQIEVKNSKNNVIGHRCGRIHEQGGHLDFIGYIFLLIIFATAMAVMLSITLLSILTGRSLYKRIKQRQQRFVTYLPTASENLDTNDVSKAKSSPTPSRPMAKIQAVIEELGSLQRKTKRSRRKRSAKEKHRYTILFMFISGICIAAYLPSLAVNAAINLDSDYFWNDVSSAVRTICLFLFQMYLINHVANPFIYGFFDTAFRREVKNMFLCLVGKKIDEPTRTLSSRRGSTSSQSQ